MSYALMLLLSDDSAVKVRRLWKLLSEGGVSHYMAHSQYTPHVTLIGCEDIISTERCRKTLSMVANECAQLSLKFVGHDIFTEPEGVLFYAVERTVELNSLHDLAEKSSPEWAKGLSKFYMKDTWLPHCTLACKLTREKLDLATKFLASEKPLLTATCNKMALVEVPSASRLVEFDLRKS